MSKITTQRVGELIRAVLELLWSKPGGLPASEIIAFIPQLTHLTDYEREYVPPSNMPRYERYLRLATIPLVKAGWLVKSNKGRWHITEEGRNVCLTHKSAQEFYDAAIRQFEDTKVANPGIIAEAERAEEKAWEQIEAFLLGLKRREFINLVADLFTSMGFQLIWTAPPDKDRGQIDLIVNKDPLGSKETRIFVQVRHDERSITEKDLKSFVTAITPSSHGVIVSTAGFANELNETVNANPQSKITLLSLESFFDLWVRNISDLDSEALLRFPLKIVYFLAGYPR